MIKKRTVLTLFVLLLALCLCSCGESGSSNEPPSPELPQVPEGAVLWENLPQYTVIRSASANLQIKEQASSARRAMQDLAQVDLSIVTDASTEPGPFEILVGETNRPESQAFYASLRYWDYGYAVENGIIILGGYTPQTLEAAIALFCQDAAVAPSEDGVFLLEGERVVRGEYPEEDMTVYGLSTKDLTVVYPKGSDLKDFVEPLTEALREQSGYLVQYCSSADPLPEEGSLLLLGVSGVRGLTAPDDLGADEGYFASNGNAVLFAGGSNGLLMGCRTLLSQVLICDGASIPLPEQERFDLRDEVLRVMSFNVLVSNRVPERIAAVLDTVRLLLPDTLGVQEANAAWIRDLSAALPEYAVVGVGRNEPKGDTEGAYVFYRADRYTLLDSGTRWLSDTPEVPSRFDESQYNRTYSYAILQRNSDGKTFVHVTVHLDHSSAEARKKQAAVLVESLKQFADYPLFVTGDFNSKNTDEVWRTMKQAGYLDASTVAIAADEGNTYSNRVIDFCFVSPEQVHVSYYRVHSEPMNGISPSDHNPLYVDALLP